MEASVALMKSQGIVDSGADIGAMDEPVAEEATA